MLARRCSCVLPALCLALAVVGIGGSARAQGQGPDYEAARRHYQAAEQAAAAGDHAAAAREYEIAYDITKDPVLFFKIGQSHDRAGDCRSALVDYDRYLKEANPSAEYRQKTEALIAGCKSRAANSPGAAPGGEDKQATAEPPPATADEPSGSGAVAGSGPGTGSGSVPASASGAGSVAAQDRELVGRPPAVVDEDTPGWERSAAWYAVGIAIALGTSAAVFGLSAASREEDVHNLINFRDTNGRPLPFTGATRDRYRDLVDEGPRLEKLSMIALAATGAAAAASAVFFVLDSRRDRPGRRRAPSSSVGAAIAPGTASLRWSGSF